MTDQKKSEAETKPRNTRWVRAAIWLLGVIVVSTLGNAVWEWITKPLLVDINNFFLHVVTLGMSSLTDRLYEQAARGSNVGEDIWSIIVGLMTAAPLLCGVLYIGLWIKTKSKVAVLEEMSELYAEWQQTNDDAGGTNVHQKLQVLEKRVVADEADDVGQRIESKRKKLRRLRRGLVPGAALMFVVAGLVFLAGIRAAYVNRAALHIVQLEQIDSPYLTENERLVFASRFAQVKDRADYLSLAKIKQSAGRGGA